MTVMKKMRGEKEIKVRKGVKKKKGRGGGEGGGNDRQETGIGREEEKKKESRCSFHLERLYKRGVET